MLKRVRLLSWTPPNPPSERGGTFGRLVCLRSQSGMTLIEVLIASAILVFGMVGIIAMFTAAARTHKRAVDETEASMVGSSVLAELRGLFSKGVIPNPTKVPPKKKDFDLDDFPAHKDFPRYHYAVRIKDLNPTRKLKDKAVFGKEYYVEVEVFWSSRGDNKSVKFQTVMFQRGAG